MGTALNKILKDMITRFHQMEGKSLYMFQAGIVMDFNRMENREQYKKKKKIRHVPVKDFRKECREFAKKWIIFISKNSKD